VKRIARWVGAGSLLFVLAIPAYADVTPQDISEARAELDEVRAELDAMSERFFDALHRSVGLEEQAAYLKRLVEDAQIELAGARRAVRNRAADMYIEASTATLTAFFSSASIVEVGTRIGYLEEIGESNEGLLRDLEVARAEYDRQLVSMRTVREEQDAVTAELEALTAQLGARLEGAQQRYTQLVGQLEEQRRREEEEQRRREEERRRREAEARAAASTTAVSTTVVTTGTEAPSTSAAATTEATTTTEAPTTTIAPHTTGGMYCPVGGITTFSDTWGAARSGGRHHEGVDMLAARGTPVVAVEEGTVLRMRSGGLGGITVWLQGGGGDQYYYAHLDGWVPGLTVGQSVQAGEELGYVGTSGNASDWLPHLHWEFHPGGGAAVNPTPLAVELCR
jgi:murein DD-endopeptidase MepM/ murein hydrolase activator NlpD